MALTKTVSGLMKLEILCIFVLIVLLGTAITTIPTSSIAVLGDDVTIKEFGKETPGANLPFSRDSINVFASVSVLARRLTLIPFLASNIASVVPQLVVPKTATLCV